MYQTKNSKLLEEILYDIYYSITIMGLWQSTMVYLKSFYNPTHKIELSATKITLSVNRLAHNCRMKTIKIQQSTKLIESQIVKSINSAPQSRSGPGEYALMEQIVRNSEKMAGYEQLVHCCEVIKNQAKMLETNPSKISQRCQLAICTILYAYDALNLGQWINLAEIVPEPRPQIDKSNISVPLREYIEFDQPSFFGVNTYALEMAYRNQISLQKINEAGHNFVHNPSKLLARQSKSSAMFYVELQQIPIEEQGDWAV